MLQAGVKVYFYQPGLLHAKTIIIDDELCSVGSTNFDFRSFEHNFEANIFFYDMATVVRLKEIFLADQRYALLLSRKLWNQRSFKNKVTESIVRLLAPLL